MSDAVLIALDWGTTNLRAALLDGEANVLDHREGRSGVGEDDAAGFAATFDTLTSGWPILPAIAAGMVGSRQGWREADYLPCPADPSGLAGALTRIEHDGRTIAIVPGVCMDDPARPDVMRGEETQVAGLVATGVEDGTAVLPGTHSKWVTLRDGRLVDFRTCMTGEVFAALSGHTVLRHTVTMPATMDEGAFADAVVEAHGDPHALTRGLFGLRAGPLLGRDDGKLGARLSGWLVGLEFAAMAAEGPLHIVGSERLCAYYAVAARRLGLEARQHEGGALVWPALLRIARVARLEGLT